MVLDNKSLANISRCTLESADKTNLSRFMSEAPWNQAAVNTRRIEYLLAQTLPLRCSVSASCLILDDTLCEHDGNLFEYIERHYNHNDGRYPLAHSLVTSHYVSGAVRFPVDFEGYQRYETAMQWEPFVKQYFPDQVLPTTAKERQQLHQRLDPLLLKDAELFKLHQQFSTKIEIASVLFQAAIDRKLPFKTVLMDSWDLCAEMVEVFAPEGKDWVSWLKCNRKLESHSFQLKDAKEHPIALGDGPMKGENLVPLIPLNAYRKIDIQGQSYWCFTRCARIPGLGKVRFVVCFANDECQETDAVLVTNRTDWSAQEILKQYLQRWTMETFDWDGKQHLGLDEYRMRTLEAMQSHWCLVFVAYSILPLGCLPPPPTKGQGQRPLHPSRTIGEVCRQQGQALIEALILFAHHRLAEGQAVAQVFQQLFAKQQQPAMR
jgi:hypothetical protein